MFAASQFYTSFTADPHFVRRGCAGAAQGLTKFACCHMFGRPTCAISAEGCPCPKEIHIPIPPRVWASDTHDLGRRLLRLKKIRISPHHMFAHPTRAISADGCPRTNKTRITPHVWVSDTPQRVRFRKPPPGCPLPPESNKKNWRSLISQEFRYKLITWKLAELLCNKFCANNLAGVL